MTSDDFNKNIPIIYLVCDIDYYNYLQCFLYFANKNIDDKQFHIHFINTPSEKIDSIIRTYPCIKNTTCEYTQLNKKNNRTALPPFSPLRHSNRMFVNSEKKKFGKLYSEKEAYCANVRFLKIPGILEQYSNDIIYIDVDNIINRDIHILYKHMVEYDLLAAPCLPNDPRLSTTIIGIKNNKKTRSVFRKMSNEIHENILDWGTDHIVYNRLINTNDIKIHILPDDFIDEEYRADSYIWINHLTMYGLSDKYQDVLNEVHLYTDTML